MNLFKSKAKTNHRDSRSYYEVFADTVTLLNTFKIVVVILMLIILFQAFLVLKAQEKPPLVIPVDSLGRARAIENYEITDKRDEIQIQAFVKEFMEAYTAWDSKFVELNFAKALNYMHSEFQKRAQQGLMQADPNDPDHGSLLEKLRAQKIYSKLEIQEIRVEKDSPQWIKVWVAGIRRVFSYLDSSYPPTETIFNAYITLAKVPRTKTEPYGLLVYDYREHLVKDITSREEKSE
jgi:hypothetical protein